MSESIDPVGPDSNTPSGNPVIGQSGSIHPGVSTALATYSERFLAASGVCLVFASVASFATIIVTQFREFTSPAARAFSPRWVDLASAQSSTIVLLIIGVVCALLGLRLLTTTQSALARTIPKDDLPMVQDAVIAGKPEPIDQYVRLRSLAGWAGTFTKLGITGLPLVTVFLTLVFSLVSLMPIPKAPDFLDLAKLTLGAFIGSFVQRNVELRRQDVSASKPEGSTEKSSIPV